MKGAIDYPSGIYPDVGKISDEIFIGSPALPDLRSGFFAPGRGAAFEPGHGFFPGLGIFATLNPALVLVRSLGRTGDSRIGSRGKPFFACLAGSATLQKTRRSTLGVFRKSAEPKNKQNQQGNENSESASSIRDFRLSNTRP